MNGLKRVIREEPTLLADAVRMVLLAFILIGLNLSDEAVLGIVAAVGAVLTVINRAMVTPNSKVDDTLPMEPHEHWQRPVLTDEERASLDELRRERDKLQARHRGT
jgi:microsomal dipeptidase-like Zn-dependent dipeptidase